MKIYSYILSSIGFIFQYIIPIMLFGNVIPYTREAGLTFVGYIAIVIIILIASGKLRGRLHEMPKGLVRALWLSLFPIAYWFIIKIGIDYIMKLFVSLANYWGYVIIFIFLGRLFYVIGEAIYEDKKGKEE